MVSTSQWSSINAKTSGTNESVFHMGVSIESPNVLFQHLCSSAVFMLIYCYVLCSAIMCWNDVAFMCNTRQHTTAVDY